jgi:hypothetical protein
VKPLCLAALLCLSAMAMTEPAGAQVPESYRGPCDASAAVAVGTDMFVVGNDEDNTLHAYRRGHAPPIASFPLSRFLDAPSAEVDIEGAAAIGARIYWISSHGRDSRGNPVPARHRLFATELRGGSAPVLVPVGAPYVSLLRDLLASEALKPFRLDAASRLPAEAEGGLNIEGLAATPDGRLLIGFRNPLPAQRALVVPLENPADVVAGMRARLGAPILLDLDRRGIRSIDLVGSAYEIVAGPTADRGRFALYRWSGAAADAPVLAADVDLGDLRPEALFAVPATSRVQLLSDDGGIVVDGRECKKLAAKRQVFRSLTVGR